MSNYLYKISFLKVSANHERISSDLMYATCYELPEVGKPFYFYKESQPFPSNTNEIVNLMIKDKIITFITKSDSVYEVAILETSK